MSWPARVSMARLSMLSACVMPSRAARPVTVTAPLVWPLTVTASSPSVPAAITRSGWPSPPGVPRLGSRLTSTSSTAVAPRSPSVIVSAPPLTTGSISFMSSRSRTTFSTSRARRRWRPWADRSSVSASLVPKKNRTLCPPWPSTASLPSPGFQMKRSLSEPRSTTSLPFLPWTSSKPGPPMSTSSPSPPKSTSAPGPPSSVNAITGSPTVLALSRSSPPRPLIVRRSVGSEPSIWMNAGRPTTDTPANAKTLGSSRAGVAFRITRSRRPSPPSASARSTPTSCSSVPDVSSTVTVSAPPRVAVRTCSTPPRSIAWHPASRTTRTRVPLADTLNRSSSSDPS